jgi:hypothetical protein
MNLPIIFKIMLLSLTLLYKVVPMFSNYTKTFIERRKIWLML